MRNQRQRENRERSGEQEVEWLQLECQTPEKPEQFLGQGPTRPRCRRQQPCERCAASARRRNHPNSSRNGHSPSEFVSNLQQIGPSRTGIVRQLVRAHYLRKMMSARTSHANPTTSTM